MSGLIGVFPIQVTTPNLDSSYVSIIDPSGKYLIVGAQLADVTSVYGLQSFAIASGLLSPVSSVVSPNGNDPGLQPMGFDPSGRWFYTGSYNAHQVYTFPFDAATGVIGNYSSSAATAGSPGGVAVVPSGDYVFVVNQTTANISRYSVGAAGVLTLLGTTATGVNPAGGGGINASGTRYYVPCVGANYIQIFSITSDGTLVSVTTVSATAPNYVLLDPSGNYLYACVSGGLQSWSISGDTLTSLGVISDLGQPYTIGIDPQGRWLYSGSTALGASMSFYSITAGVLALLGTTPTYAYPNDGTIAVDPSGSYVYFVTSATEISNPHVGGGVNSVISFQVSGPGFQPTPPSGVGSPVLNCIDYNDNEVLQLTSSPNANGDYVKVGVTTFTCATGLVIPAYCWLQLFISQATQAQYAGQTLAYSLVYFPYSGGWQVNGVQQPISILAGKLYFKRPPAQPETYVV